MMRIGIGYDLHRIVEDRPLVLGGVTIPWNRGLHGHSDADVLVHAIIDALLGATALGNIGQLYPDTDPAYKGADSMELLADTMRRVTEHGYKPVNVDATLIAQQPKLNPHLDEIREQLGDVLDLPMAAVSVKAKTNEGVGPEGREEAMSAQAVVLLESL